MTFVYKDIYFSTVKKILTDLRHNLAKDVEGGRTNSSWCERETGIRNNLVSLPIANINKNLHATSGSCQKNY